MQTYQDQTWLERLNFVTNIFGVLLFLQFHIDQRNISVKNKRSFYINSNAPMTQHTWKPFDTNYECTNKFRLHRNEIPTIISNKKLGTVGIWKRTFE